MKRNLVTVGALAFTALLATAGAAAFAHGNGQHQGCTPGEGKECPAAAKAEHQHDGMQGRMQGKHGNMEANHARMAERHAQMAARHGSMQHGGMQGGMHGGQPPAASDDSKPGEHKH